MTSSAYTCTFLRLHKHNIATPTSYVLPGNQTLIKAKDNPFSSRIESYPCPSFKLSRSKVHKKQLRHIQSRVNKYMLVFCANSNGTISLNHSAQCHQRYYEYYQFLLLHLIPRVVNFYFIGILSFPKFNLSHK